MADGEGQGNNYQGGGQGAEGGQNLQGNNYQQGNQQGGDLNFRYSDSTPMTEFFRDYPQYAQNPNFNKYRTVKAFAEGHEALLSKLGTAVNIPNQYSTKEQIDEFYNKLGRPETPEAYEFKDDLPEGWSIDQALDKEYRSLAHEIGLSATQAQKLRAFYNTAVETAYNNNQKEVQTRLAESHDKNVAAIKEMWGGDYQAKTRIAMTTARQVLSQETLDYLDATGLGNNANIVRDFYELSKRLSGQSGLRDGDNYRPAPTLETMEAEAMKILRTPGWENDPALKRKYEELTQQRADILYK